MLATSLLSLFRSLIDMTENTLEKAVIKLTCQLLDTEEERDRWKVTAASLDNQLTHSKASLAGRSKDNLEKNARLKALQEEHQKVQSENVDLSHKLRRIALSASTTKAKLRSEGEESKFVNDVLQAFECFAKSNEGGTMRRRSTRDTGSAWDIAHHSSAYWDDSSSGSS